MAAPNKKKSLQKKRSRPHPIQDPTSTDVISPQTTSLLTVPADVANDKIKTKKVTGEEVSAEKVLPKSKEKRRTKQEHAQEELVKEEKGKNAKEKQVKEEQTKEGNVKEDPAKEDHVKPKHAIKDKQIKEEQTKEEHVKPKQVKEEQTKEEHVKPKQVKEEQTKEGNVKEDRAKEEHVKPKQADEEHAKHKQVKKEPPKEEPFKGKRPTFLEEMDYDHDVRWMKQFLWIKLTLIIFGRWPITCVQESHKRGYIFKYSWSCFGFGVFFITVLLTLYGLISSAVNIVAILMRDKVTSLNSRTKTQIIEQGLVERHTLIVIIMLSSYGLNTLTLFFIFVKRHEISETLTKWTRFLNASKLNGAPRNTYLYAGIALVNYMTVSIIFFFLATFKASATFIGGPTVVAIISARQFFSDDYLENFVGSTRHKVMHSVGMLIYFYVVTSCNIYMYLFLWLLKSIENAFSSWNARLSAVVETDTSSMAATQGVEGNKRFNISHPRLTYNALYRDHIGLVRMLSWFNSMFAYTLEPFILFMLIRIVYQMYLAALVIRSNGKPLSNSNLGKYFIRKGDYIFPLVMTYENCFMLLTMLLASSWLEDTAYDSYDVLRSNCLLLGSPSDKKSFFFLSMFQSYISTTKMAVCGGQFFCIDRYTILHVLSAIMSNFLVVYQFAPLFDMETVGYEELRKIMGDFLTLFEGLPEDHTLPVSDTYRNRNSFRFN